MFAAKVASWVTPRRAPTERARVGRVLAPSPAPRGVEKINPSRIHGVSERWVVWYPRKKKGDGDGTTKKQLRQMAEKAGVYVDETMSKKQLREAMEKAGVAIETKQQLREAAERAGVAVSDKMSKKRLREKAAEAAEKAAKAEKAASGEKPASEGSSSKKQQRKDAAKRAAAERAAAELAAAERAAAERAALLTMDDSDGVRLASADGDGGSDVQKSSSRLKRAIPVVGLLLTLWVLAVAAAFDPAAFRAGRSIVVSLVMRLAVGSRSNDGFAEAALCVFSIVALRLGLEKTTRAVYFWWTVSATEKTWLASTWHWLLLNVYAPLELALVAVASLRFTEAGVERFGLVVPPSFNAVVDVVVRAALVLAFSRVFLSWQQRMYSTQAEQLEVEGKTLQAERLAGIQKLSTIATYILAAVLGLKVCGVDVGALVTFGGISGLAIGLAGRQILENAFMGLMLYATAPFAPGEEIRFSTSQVKDIKGYVLDIGLFRTTIRSMQREVYYLPNSLFSSLAVLNVSRRGKHFRVKKEVVVRLDDAPRLSNALANFRSVVKSDPRVVRSMHRRVFLDSVSTEGLHVKISFFVEAVNKDQFFAIQMDLLQAFLETCRKNDVRVAPQIRAVMSIKEDEPDGLDGPLASDEAAAALAKAAEKAKDKDSGLAAALTALTKGAGKYEGAG